MCFEDTNRCVCCGVIIPEGTQVCKKCQREADRDGCLHLWQFEKLVKRPIGGKYILWSCAFCGKKRLEAPPKRRLEWPDAED